MQWEYQKEKKDRTEEIFEETKIENSPQINIRHQTTGLRSSENTKQDKFQKTTPKHFIFKVQKIKGKEKNLLKSQKK